MSGVGVGGGEYAGAGQDLKIKSEMIKSDELGTVSVTCCKNYTI